MHCGREPFTLANLVVQRNAINERPPYQRESAIWSVEKKQLFIDSLFNEFDVPKIYLHDLRGKDRRYDFAIIDGKQRLDAVWEFLDNKFPLANDFRLLSKNKRVPKVRSGSYFKDLADGWPERFKSRTLDVALVQDASEDDIEELFSRLNNGEALTAAEKRNAMGGDMCKLVRETAKSTFFKEKLRFSNKRYQYLEVAAKFLLIENDIEDGGSGFCDLKKRYLDKLVRGHATMTLSSQKSLALRVTRQLSSLKSVFGKRDPLLSKQAYAPLYYLLVKVMEGAYADKALYGKLHGFLESFQVLRQSNLAKPEEKQDPTLIEFGRLMQQGTNDLNSLTRRVSLLRRFFLLDHPEVSVRDKKRSFTEEERIAIWILGKKRCAICKRKVELEEMQADHHEQWAHGGATSLENGRALCENCNKSIAAKVC